MPTLVAWPKAGPGGSGSGCRGSIWYVQYSLGRRCSWHAGPVTAIFLVVEGCPSVETFQKYTLQGQVLLPLARKQRSKLRRGQSLQEHSLSHTAGTLKGLAARLVSEKCDCHPVALLGNVLISTGLISASKPGADSRQPCYSMVSIFF